MIAVRIVRDDDGFTLVELMIASLLLGVVLIVAGGMLISSITGQRDVTNVGNATSGAQLVAGSLENGIRNAAAFQVATVADVGQRVDARTAAFDSAGTPTWACKAWIYTTDHRVLVASGTTRISSVTGLGAAGLGGWTLLASNVTVPAGGAAFVPDSLRRTLTIDLQVGVDQGDGKPAYVTTQVSRLPLPTTAGTGPTACF